MILHKPKKKKTANMLTKQALYLHQKNTGLFIWNNNK